MTRAKRLAAEHMANGGELRVYVSAGPYCARPPKQGSGVIDSHLGRLYVSKRTVRWLMSVGLKAIYRDYRYGKTPELNTFDGWLVAASPARMRALT